MASAIEQIADEFIETDVLIMGAGMAGCCAAARAAEEGLNVIMAEKSHSKRSGNAAMGIDYYIAAKPEISQGADGKEILERWRDTYVKWTGGAEGLFNDPKIMHNLWEKG